MTSFRQKSIYFHFNRDDIQLHLSRKHDDTGAINDVRACSKPDLHSMLKTVIYNIPYSLSHLTLTLVCLCAIYFCLFCFQDGADHGDAD